MAATLLVLATGPGGAATVDLASGSLLRTYWAEAPADDLQPFDVVEVERAALNDEFPFPRDTVVTTSPHRSGRLTGRRAERILKPLVLPESQPLLGAPAPSVPYWTLRDDQPTLALVVPNRGPVIERDSGLHLHCRFRWRRLDHDLPLDDPMVDELLSHPTAVRLAGGTLARALGWRPHRLVVALTPPREGLCQKVVAGLLPKP